MRQLPFTKMHGLGNDFVIIDARADPFVLDRRDVCALGDRRRGVGFDQLLTILPAEDGGHARLVIHNPDGRQAEACGNGTRCVADLLMGAATEVTIETVAGPLRCRRRTDGRISVDMGTPLFDWRDIPLAQAHDTLEVPVPGIDLPASCCVSMGNPHAVFFVPDVEEIAVGELGPELEHHPLFPEGANIEFVTVESRTRLRTRVWERGAGQTLACGSGACAVAVAAVRRSLAARSAEVVLDGGVLEIEWTPDGRVEMTGPTVRSFTGTVDLEALEAGRAP